MLDFLDNQTAAIIYGGVLLLGLCIIVSGFKQLRLKRFVENIPKENIQNGPTGKIIEIKGKILMPKGAPHIAPTTEEPCAYYELEMSYSRGDSSGDTTVGFISSTPGFFIEDASGGVALVIPAIEVFKVFNNWMKHTKPMARSHKNYYIQGMDHNEFSKYPQILRNVWEQNQNNMWLSDYRPAMFRFYEQIIKPGEEIKVLGFAYSCDFTKRQNKLESLFAIGKEGYRNYRYRTYHLSKLAIMNDEQIQTENQYRANKTLEVFGEQEIRYILSKLKMVFAYKDIEFGGRKILNPIISNQYKLLKNSVLGGDAFLQLILGPALLVYCLIELLRLGNYINW